MKLTSFFEDDKLLFLRIKGQATRSARRLPLDGFVMPCSGRLFLLRHHALDIEAGELGLGVGADGDALLEVARKLARAVVGHGDGALLSWSDRLLVVARHGASATRHDLVEHQGLVADIGEGEYRLLDWALLRERAKILRDLVKLDLGLSQGGRESEYEHHGQ